MSTKKKPTIHKLEDKPKYKVGDKLYFIDRTNSKPRIFYGVVEGIQTLTYSVKDKISSKITGTTVNNIYCIETGRYAYEVVENRLYTTFPAIALEFAKEYLVSI